MISTTNRKCLENVKNKQRGVPVFIFLLLLTFYNQLFIQSKSTFPKVRLASFILSNYSYYVSNIILGRYVKAGTLLLARVCMEVCSQLFGTAYNVIEYHTEVGIVTGT